MVDVVVEADSLGAVVGVASVSALAESNQGAEFEVVRCDEHNEQVLQLWRLRYKTC